MSTAFQVKDQQGHQFIQLLRRRGRGKFRLYLDSGTAGAGYDGVERTREFARAAQEHGWKTGIDFLHVEASGAEHNEAAWRTRARTALEFAITTPRISN